MAADEINSGIAANCSPEDAGLGASDRAGRLLRLARLAEDLGVVRLGKKHAISPAESRKAASTWPALVNANAANRESSTP
jgi:hypothetical protein